MPLFRRELIERRGYISENELIDYYSVGQCLPGVIAINVATFTGYKVQGVSGAIAATLAVNLPSLVIIMALAGILNTLSENQIVSHAFAGIRIGVIALILNEVVLLFRKAVATQFQAVIFVAVLALLFWLHLSAVAVVLLAAGAWHTEIPEEQMLTYGVLFWEFFKIGLFAVGGGMVTIPFLFDLTRKFDWFTAEELTNMIAVSQSTPGPVGVNMATYAGFQAAGVWGGIIATFGLALPSMVIVIWVSKLLKRCAQNPLVCEIMAAIRPAVVALILLAGAELFKLSVTNYVSGVFAAVFFAMVYFYKRSPIFYIILAAVLGVALKL